MQHSQAAILGTEVVAPVGNAVSLVDYDQAGISCQGREHLIAEVRVVQALGADQKDVEIIGCDAGMDVVPFGDVARIDGCGAHSGTFGRTDLVSHQGQQRRDDDGGAVARCPEQLRRDEVDRRFAPAGPLYDERAFALHHQRLDGRPLVLA